MKTYAWLGIFLLIVAPVFSNDSRTTVGSSVRIIDNENTNISMVEEEIIITLHRGYYEVDVNFDFYNDGPAEKISLGFPIDVSSPGSPPEENEMAEIITFDSYINGNLLTEYTMKEETDMEDYYKRVKRWYIREVTFPANSHTYSRVTYKTPYSYQGFSTVAGYIYGTGRSWKGPIGKMTVIINQSDDVVIQNVRFGNDRTPDFTWEANGKYRYVLENIKPNGNESIWMEINSFYFYGNRYNNAFDVVYDGWCWNEELLEDSFYKFLFTKNQMQLFSNFFYYKHGYEFRSNDVCKDYFDLARLTEYKYRTINPDFSEEDFNEIERKNIDYLLDLEKKVPPGGNEQPLKEWLNSIIEDVDIASFADEPEKNYSTSSDSKPPESAKKKLDKGDIIAIMMGIAVLVLLIVSIVGIIIAVHFLKQNKKDKTIL